MVTDFSFFVKEHRFDEVNNAVGLHFRQGVSESFFEKNKNPAKT